MKIIISERQLKLISEQLLPWLGTGADVASSGIDINWERAVNSNQGRVLSSQERVERLFNDAKKWTSTPQDWNSIKNVGSQMYTALNGAGSGNFLTLLSQINTKNKLAALVKNWNYDGYNLYQWLEDEYTITWGDILKVLEKYFKSYITYSLGPSL
jgi:hypothetical protein